MHASTTGMETTRTVLLVLGLLCLTCLASGLSETKADQSGTFSVEDYSDWLENHTINVVNYVAEVGTDVVILSPITPPPIGMRWFSLNFDGELRRPVGREVGRVGSTKSEKFLETYNTSWQSVFTFDKLNRWLRIRKVQLGYGDLFRVFVGENGTEETAGRGSEERQAFDVAITLMTFEKHECGFTSKPQNPKAGDTLILSCSVIVNGMWNASLIFRNNYDEREIVRETKTCGIKRSVGSKICSSVRVRAETDILAYSCLLGFLSDGKHVPKHPMFQNSKWTADFNKKVACNLPKIKLGAIPSDVTLLCSNMPCGETVFVNDTVTCVAHGYPQPVFDLRIRDVSEETGNNSESQGVGYENRFFMDTDEEERDDGFGGDYTKAATAVEIKGHEDFRIGLTNVGHIEITCNVSNALGWGYNSLVLEVKISSSESETDRSGKKPTFRLEDYNSWKKHQINLVNYVAEVGSNVLIWSPIIPAPIGIHWFSLNMDGEMPRSYGKDVDLTNSSHLEKFHTTYNTSWEIVFDYDRSRRWLKIQKVPLGYADVFRVFVDDSETGNSDEKTPFDVAIALMTYEKHECGYVSKPPNPTEGDEFVLNCSVIVNGWWNASLVFRNAYDGSEIRGELSECNDQPSTGTTKICSTVRIKAETDILAYSCRLEFPPIERHDLESPLFQNSKWTDAFNTEVVCYLPEIYLEVIPSDVTFLCNNMPCGDTALVNDTITCVAHGNPPPIFDLRIQRLSVGHDNKSKAPEFEVNNDKRFFMDTSDGASEVQIRGSASYRMSKADMGQVEITCNVSNGLGWGFNSMIQEIKLRHEEGAVMETPLTDVGGIATGGNLRRSLRGSVPEHLFQLTCNDKPCDYFVNVGDVLSFNFLYSDGDLHVVIKCLELWIGNSPKEWRQKCLYTFTVEDVGPKFVRILTISFFGRENLIGDFYVVSASFGDYNILCNYWPCLEDRIMKVGDKISLYLDKRKFSAGVSMTVNLFGFSQSNGIGTWFYSLEEKDIGRMLIKYRIYNDVRNTIMERNIIVVSVSDFGDYNILCNMMPCLEDGIMKVGDKISLYTDPRIFGNYRWNVSLPGNEAPYTLKTWYHTLGVNDVGRKSIKFDIYEDLQNFTMTRNIIVISDQPIGVDVMCNGTVCRDNETMRFGDEISCYFEPNVLLKGMTFTLLIDDYNKVEGYPCTYALREEDVGPKLIQCNSQGEAGTYQKTRNINIACAYRNDFVGKPAKEPFENTPIAPIFRKDNVTYKSGAIILCGDEPCDMPGRTIYTGTYVSCRMNDGQKTTLKLIINGRVVSWKRYYIVSELSYKLQRTGIAQMECYGISHAFNSSSNVTLRVQEWPCPANVQPPNVVTSGNQSVDMMCNGKFCHDNEIMRFGDEISCYFEPKFMIDGMTFTLLIDNYVKIKGYPCTYVLREEDVGTKLVQCNSRGKDARYKKTRKITVICEFRDEVVLKPVKKGYDDTPYDIKFRKDNVTFPSGAIILCGDEPCDKPGRTIYTGTYVSCRMNDGQKTTLNFKVNLKLISMPMPAILSELSYKLNALDINGTINGTSQAICSGTGTALEFINATVANFTVHAWPCPANVKPASANVFDHEKAADEADFSEGTEFAEQEHGDAAGAIDVDQAENIDSGPTAGSKGAVKWTEAENDKPKPSIGSGRESFVLLQLFLAFIAAFVGLGQF